VTALPGASVFDSALSFAMIRGGHVDLAILAGSRSRATRPGELDGARQADHRHGRRDGSGGGARRVVVLQSHASKDGKSKLVSAADAAADALGCVARRELSPSSASSTSAATASAASNARLASTTRNRAQHGRAVRF